MVSQNTYFVTGNLDKSRSSTHQGESRYQDKLEGQTSFENGPGEAIIN